MSQACDSISYPSHNTSTFLVFFPKEKGSEPKSGLLHIWPSGVHRPLPGLCQGTRWQEVPPACHGFTVRQKRADSLPVPSIQGLWLPHVSAAAHWKRKCPRLLRKTLTKKMSSPILNVRCFKRLRKRSRAGLSRLCCFPGLHRQNPTISCFENVTSLQEAGCRM